MRLKLPLMLVEVFIPPVLVGVITLLRSLVEVFIPPVLVGVITLLRPLVGVIIPLILNQSPPLVQGEMLLTLLHSV